MVKSVSVLGSTGSIGRQTLDVVAQRPDQFRIVALTAQNNVELLIAQAKQFRPLCIAIENEDHKPRLNEALSGQKIEILLGAKGIEEAAKCKADCVVSAITGIAGLKPTMAAVAQGADLALANKESLVCAGEFLLDAVRKIGKTILPVDSEHNAIFQALCGQQSKNVRKLILTASGGPFRETPLDDLKHVTVKDALNHPTWQMGQKISVDSATMMNKGLELIEASYLFDKTESEIDIVIHPQSVVHSMVEFSDGSTLAQLGASDMRVPISFCLGWPERIQIEARTLDWSKALTLEFSQPDQVRFPALALARQVARAGSASCVIFNASNEVAVEAFLQGRISFLNIVQLVKKMLDAIPNETLSVLDDVLGLNQMTRAKTLAAL